MYYTESEEPSFEEIPQMEVREEENIDPKPRIPETTQEERDLMGKIDRIFEKAQQKIGQI